MPPPTARDPPPCPATAPPRRRAPQLLLTMRLPLVFDLDETLLVAKSQSQMAKELKALRDVRCAALSSLHAAPRCSAGLATRRRGAAELSPARCPAPVPHARSPPAGAPTCTAQPATRSRRSSWRLWTGRSS